MKKFTCFLKKGNQVSFLLLLAIIFNSSLSFAQASPEIFGAVRLLKVDMEKKAEFETFMKEKMKPVHELRREKGMLVLWILFKVHFAGDNDEYNYAEVSYHPGWASTEQTFKLRDLISEAHEGSDAEQMIAKLNELRSVSRFHMLYQLEAVEPNPPVPSKYVVLDYMKMKAGKTQEYLNMEREDWIPFHRALVNEGKCSGWGLWQLVFPSGTASSYDYVTSRRYTIYDQILSTNYAETFRKVSPGKDVRDIFTRAANSRDLVRAEVWEVVDILN